MIAEFKDKMGDTLEVSGVRDGTVSILITYERDRDGKKCLEAWLNADDAMDVAAAIVRAVHGDPP